MVFLSGSLSVFSHIFSTVLFFLISFGPFVLFVVPIIVFFHNLKIHQSTILLCPQYGDENQISFYHINKSVVRFNIIAIKTSYTVGLKTYKNMWNMCVRTS